jgi:hypothetical protein
MQGSDKYLPRPLPEAEEALAQYSPSFDRMENRAVNRQVIHDIREQLEAITAQLGEFL